MLRSGRMPPGTAFSHRCINSLSDLAADAAGATFKALFLCTNQPPKNSHGKVVRTQCSTRYAANTYIDADAAEATIKGHFLCMTQHQMEKVMAR